jgi:hypothetical protein
LCCLSLWRDSSHPVVASRDATQLSHTQTQPSSWANSGCDLCYFTEFFCYLKMTHFRDIALCSLIEAERRFKGPYCLHPQGDVGQFLPDYMAQRARR